MTRVKNIAIFASGGGSNAEMIMNHFESNASVQVALVVVDKKGAGAIQKAKSYNVPVFIHNNEDLKNGNLISELKKHDIDLIVLAGYLKLIPIDLINEYAGRIVNIHPALLPKFGGKGMYGMNVHRAVIEAGERESGPTIHFVNENYDEGAIIAQYKCVVRKEDSPEDLQKRVLKLEHDNYAKCIENLISEM